MDAQPLKLTTERREGWLLNVSPFCISAHSGETHLCVLLFMASYQNSLRYRTRNRGTELDASPNEIEDRNDDQRKDG